MKGNKRIFKAYDIRGKYPSEINEKVVLEIARALVRFFRKGKVIVGRDARLSSLSLYRVVLSAFAAEINHSKTLKNLRIVSVGLTTTPMLYFLVNKLGARGGIMVTASHNPKEYNGLKVVGKKAGMISGKEILRIMNLRTRASTVRGRQEL